MKKIKILVILILSLLLISCAEKEETAEKVEQIFLFFSFLLPQSKFFKTISKISLGLKSLEKPAAL